MIKHLRALGLAAVLALVALPAFAQSTITRTTTSEALTVDQIEFTVGSLTNIVAGYTGFIDDEQVRIISVNTTTTRVRVRRSQGGTTGVTHASGAIFHTGLGDAFDVTWRIPLAAQGALSIDLKASTMPKTFMAFKTLTPGSQTLLIADMLGGWIQDTAGGAETMTTPTAAQIIAAIPRAKVGDTFCFWLKNTAGGANTITVAGGANVTIVGTATIAQNNMKQFLVQIVSPTAVNVNSLGTVVF